MSQLVLKIWVIVFASLSVVSLISVVYFGLGVTGHIVLCDPYNCKSQLTDDNRNSVSCFTIVAENRRTFNRTCRWYEGCNRLDCPDNGICYIVDNRLSFGKCPKDDIYMMMFIFSFVAVACFPGITLECKRNVPEGENKPVVHHAPVAVAHFIPPGLPQGPI